MALPLQSAFLRPILEITAQAEKRLSYQEILAQLIPLLSLSEDDLQERTPHGSLRVEKHTRYSMSSLKRSELLDAPAFGAEKGRYRITEKGRQYLRNRAAELDQARLNMLAAEQEQRPNLPAPDRVLSGTGAISPEEQIEVSHDELRGILAEDLLDSIKGVSPERFEVLVVELLSKMGYGTGQQVGRTGDGGIDGVISQDPLGFEKVYVQAKRLKRKSVSAPQVRDFSGSLDQFGATKGVFITTADGFSKPAEQAAADAARNSKTIVLINGSQLADLMIEHSVGVITKTVYEVKEIDENYFADI